MVTMGPRVSALSMNSRQQVALELSSIRDALKEGRLYGTSTVEHVRREALVHTLSLAAPRLRALVQAEGATQPDGTTRLRMDGSGYVLTLGSGRSGTGEAVPSLDVEGTDEDGETITLLNARFFDDSGSDPWAAASCRSDCEVAILDFLDAAAPHMPKWDGTLVVGLLARYRAEHEMVRADGGFPGATCREHLERLREEAVRGMMLAVARELPGLAQMQKAAGYVWGGQYLAYDDTDKRACAVPVAGAVACFHENIDLIDDRISWIVAVEPGDGADGGRVAAWSFKRGEGNPVDAASAAMSGGLATLGEPDISVALAGGTPTVREGLDPGALVGNVLHGVTRDIEAFKDLPSTFRGIGTEVSTDFTTFLPGTFDDDWDEEEEAEASPPGP